MIQDSTTHIADVRLSDTEETLLREAAKYSLSLRYEGRYKGECYRLGGSGIFHIPYLRRVQQRLEDLGFIANGAKCWQATPRGRAWLSLQDPAEPLLTVGELIDVLAKRHPRDKVVLSAVGRAIAVGDVVPLNRISFLDDERGVILTAIQKPH